MILDTQNIHYCLYARKSSESDERQAMSIDSQIKEMKGLTEREKFVVKEVREENHSAKQSSQRPIFNQLLLDIQAGTGDVDLYVKYGSQPTLTSYDCRSYHQ